MAGRTRALRAHQTGAVPLELVAKRAIASPTVSHTMLATATRLLTTSSFFDPENKCSEHTTFSDHTRCASNRSAIAHTVDPTGFEPMTPSV